MPFPDPMTNVADFIASVFGSRLITDSAETDVVIGTAATQIVAQNPRRVALYLSNTGNVSITLSRVNTLTPATGLIIGPGGFLDLYWFKELREIEKNWFAIASAAGGAVHVREVYFV